MIKQFADNKYIKLAVFLSVIAALLSSYTLVGIAAILAVYICLLLKKSVLLNFIIIGFLALTGPQLDEYRDYINLSLLLILFIFYLKTYGMNFFPKDIPGSLKIFLVLFFASLFLSSAFSKDQLNSFLSILRSAVFFMICYFFYSFIESKKIVYNYILSLFLGMIIVGITVIYDFLNSGISSFFIGDIVSRFSGIYGNPNYVGMLVVITIPLSIIFLKIFTGRTVRALMISFLVFQIIVLILSDSRASMLGSFVASLFVLCILYRGILFKFMLPLIFSLIILIFSDPGIGNFFDLYLRIERISNREVFWQAGLDIIKDYPLLGVGPDMFDKYFFSYMPSWVSGLYESGKWIVGRPHPHNFFLLYAAENGILGLITSVTFFILFFYLSFKTIKLAKKSDNRDYYYLSIGITGIGLGMLVRSFYEVTGVLTYGFITRDLPFWICFIIIVHLYQDFKVNLHQEL